MIHSVLNDDVELSAVLARDSCRGTFPDLELRSILRLNAAIIAVMGMEKALLTLGHAVATVLDRESFAFYYR